MSIVYKLKSLWWKNFFPSPIFKPLLGDKLQQAREEKGMSVAEVSAALHFSENIVIALESGENHQTAQASLFDPGYFRLAAVEYAHFLKLDFNEIKTLLPPPAPLQHAYTTFVGKLSPLQQSPLKPHSIKEEPSVVYSFKEIKSIFWKGVIVVVAIIASVYFWNLIRHLLRAIS